MRVVFDTNFWLQVFISKKNLALFDAIYTNELDVISCTEQEQELRNVLKRKAIGGKKLFPPLEDYVNLYKEHSDFIEAKPSRALIRNYRDTYLWNLCAEARTELLVTNDTDFNILRTLSKPPFQVINSAIFWSFYKV
jgi:putative PIN family toxin of toxin-antitoxin system